MKLFKLDRVSLPCAVFSIPLSLASWYTWKIDRMGEALLHPEYPLLSVEDLKVLFLIFLLLFAILPPVVRLFLSLSFERQEGTGSHLFLPAFLFMALWQVPSLLALYPAPGMNDTLFMMENPLYAGVQFPWFYSLIYGYGAAFGKAVLGTRELVIFALSLVQLLVYSYGLTAMVFFVRKRYGRNPGIFLYAWFTFFPMVGNYGIAAVRDGLFSLSLLWCMVLFSDGPIENRKKMLMTAGALLGLMMFRSNGIFISAILVMALCLVTGKWKKPAALFLLCAVAAILPGRVILSTHGWQPLFQESMAIPLQQMGRVLVLDGERSEKTKELMAGLLPEEKWKKGYSPATVDFVKWDDHFRRNELNGERVPFLKAWLDTGLKNPRLYVEGWMTETYALWNLDPLEHDVQSRFGWALSDENTKNMKPSDNDMLALGDFPMPFRLKSFLGNYSYSGSRFLGAGISLWMTLFLCLLFYCGGRKRLILAALPLWANTLTLLVSTPASAVFRYSFAYVLGLPLLVLVFLYEKGRD